MHLCDYELCCVELILTIYCRALSFYSYMVAMVIFSIYRSVFTDIMDYIHPINELILSKDNVQVWGDIIVTTAE